MFVSHLVGCTVGKHHRNAAARAVQLWRQARNRSAGLDHNACNSWASQSLCQPFQRSSWRLSATASEGSEATAPAETSARTQQRASDVLATFASQRSQLSLRGRLQLLLQVEHLEPSAYDERLQQLVDDILDDQEKLPLGALVDVSRAVKHLRLGTDLSSLVSLCTANADFLPSEPLALFAKEVLLTTRQQGRSRDLLTEEAPAEGAAMFRILSEHVERGLQRASGSRGNIEEQGFSSAVSLSEALLTLACFHREACVHRPGMEPSQSWAPTVFSLAADRIQEQVADLPPRALAKLLLAFRTWLQAAGHRPLLADQGVHGTAELDVPLALVGHLGPRVAEIPAKQLVRSMHAMSSLHRCGLGLDSKRAMAFFGEALPRLAQQIKEVDVQDLSFALEAVAALWKSGCLEAWQLQGATKDLLRILYAEVPQHVAALSAREALRMARSAAALKRILRPGLATELLAAELARELEFGNATTRSGRRRAGAPEQGLSAEQICHTITSFTRLRHTDYTFVQQLGLGLVAHLPDCPPKVLAVSMHGLVKAGLKVGEDTIFREAAVSITRNRIGFLPKDFALVCWAYAKASRRNMLLFLAVQDDLKRTTDLSELKPEDMSMLLWSFARVDLRVDGDVLSGAVQNVSRHRSRYSNTALLVTCLSFSRLGFARQPVLIDLYRSVYSRLPELSTSQLAFSFFLFSTSGIRDEALVNRFAFECRQRMQDMHGQDLSNISLACSRVMTSATLEQSHGLAALLRSQVLQELGKLQKGPVLGIFLSAPSILQLTEEENLQILEILTKSLPDMDGTELARCLVASARLSWVHKPFLLPLYQFLRRKTSDLTAQELVACIWTVHSLGFCTSKLRRRLGFELRERTRRREIPVRMLSDVLPALNKLGYWSGLQPKLRRAIWKMASADVRKDVEPPPPPATESSPSPEEMQEKMEEYWRLPPLEKGRLQKRRLGPTWFSAYHDLQSVEKDPQQEDVKEKSQEVPGQAYGSGRTALQDFVTLINRL